MENGQKIFELGFPLTALLLKEGQRIKRKQVEKWHFFIGTNLSICCYANIDCHPYVCNRKNSKSLNHSFARNAFFFAFVIVSALKCSEDAKIKNVSEWVTRSPIELSCPGLLKSLLSLGKGSIEKKTFSFELWGGGLPMPEILALCLEVHFWSIKRVFFFKNANVLNF